MTTHVEERRVAVSHFQQWTMIDKIESRIMVQDKVRREVEGARRSRAAELGTGYLNEMRASTTQHYIVRPMKENQLGMRFYCDRYTIFYHHLQIYSIGNSQKILCESCIGDMYTMAHIYPGDHMHLCKVGRGGYMIKY